MGLTARILNNISLVEDCFELLNLYNQIPFCIVFPLNSLRHTNKNWWQLFHVDSQQIYTYLYQTLDIQFSRLTKILMNYICNFECYK